jgi:hypothetical protein
MLRKAGWIEAVVVDSSMRENEWSNCGKKRIRDEWMRPPPRAVSLDGKLLDLDKSRTAPGASCAALARSADVGHHRLNASTVRGFAPMSWWEK